MLNIKGFKVKYNEKRDIYQVYKEKKVAYFRDIHQIEKYALILFRLNVTFRHATKKEINTFNGGIVYNMSNYTYTRCNLSDSIDINEIESNLENQF